MPKDDPDEEKKKKSPNLDDEEMDFDEQIEKSDLEDDLEDDDLDPKPKRKSPPSDEEEQLDDELLDAGSKEVFGRQNPDEDDRPAPKPTFTYNVAPPPSDDPVARPTEEHTLDDLSEEDLNPQPKRSFQVDRGVPPQMPYQEEAPPVFPRPRTNMPSEDELYADQNDPMHIPSIRKQNPIYPPHNQRSYEDTGYDAPRQQNPAAQQRPQYNTNPYGQDPNQRFGYRDRQPKGATKWHIIVLLLIGGGVVAATVYLLQNQFNFPGSNQADVTPAPSANVQITEATPAPAATPAPVERKDFKVRVLNGTTEPGIAKKVLDKMKELGYQTDRAGNAPKQDYTQTTIRVKEGAAALSAQLTKDLTPDYEATILVDLKAEDPVDAEIILGEK